MFKWTEMRVGSALVCYRLRDWMRQGKCTLETSAASGLVTEMQELPGWLEVDTFYQPFFQSTRVAEGDGEEVRDPHAELFVRMAEHFRSVVIPQQGETWREELPRVPLTMNELKEVLCEREGRDERAAIKELARKGSSSAEIIEYLGLTRELVREAFVTLRGVRQLQVGLANILGATRFKVLTQGRVYHVKCPKTFCFEKDSFQHMLKCYGLTEHIAVGAEVVPFLVKMARITMIPKGTKRIPYMVEYRAERREEGEIAEEG